MSKENLERVLGEYEIDTVFHLAAQTIVGVANRNPVSTLDTNIRGTWSLLESCRRSPQVKQVVLASSDKAYGEGGFECTEETRLEGTHPYDVSKSCADLIAKTFAKTYKIPITITRCGNFYGGGDLNWNRIVPGTIRAILRGQPPFIRSDGKMVRDYFYVEDGVSAYIRSAESLAQDPELSGEAFNFSNERPLTTLQMVEAISNLMGFSGEPIIANIAKYEIEKQSLNATKARNILGWQTIYSLEEGLEKTLAWYKNYFAREGEATGVGSGE